MGLPTETRCVEELGSWLTGRLGLAAVDLEIACVDPGSCGTCSLTREGS